jgi:hypothetical protein
VCCVPRVDPFLVPSGLTVRHLLYVRHVGSALHNVKARLERPTAGSDWHRQIGGGGARASQKVGTGEAVVNKDGGHTHGAHFLYVPPFCAARIVSRVGGELRARDSNAYHRRRRSYLQRQVVSAFGYD